jgi:hypothetical protein
MNFVAAALAAVKAGSRGVVAIPVKANWGPVREFVTITRQSELIAAYTESEATNITAYRCGYLALLGGAKKVLMYRLADSSAAKASITLQDSASTNMVKLETLYPSTRAFNVTTQDNAVDSTNKTDVKLYEGTTLLRTMTVPKGSADNIVTAINNDTGNLWVVASKVAGGNGILKSVAAQNFTGGNAGVSSITNTDYINAQEALETIKFNIGTLDGNTNDALQTSFAEWVKRVRSEGKTVIWGFGGAAAVDKASDAIDQGADRSAAFNHEGIFNVGTGAILDGTEYTSAEIACYICGAIAGQQLKESITYFATPFDDVSRRMTGKSEMEAAVNGGLLVLYHDGTLVKVLRGMNSLVTLRQGQNNQFKKIRAIRVMDAINDDLLSTAEANYIGKVNNTEEGRLALIGAFKEYMRLLAVGEVIEREGWDVYLHPDWYGKDAQLTPEPDQVFTRWEARITDVIEQIFGEFIVK